MLARWLAGWPAAGRSGPWCPGRRRCRAGWRPRRSCHRCCRCSWTYAKRAGSCPSFLRQSLDLLPGSFTGQGFGPEVIEREQGPGDRGGVLDCLAVGGGGQEGNRGSVGEFGDDEGSLQPDVGPSAERDDLDGDVWPGGHVGQVLELAGHGFGGADL